MPKWEYKVIIADVDWENTNKPAGLGQHKISQLGDEEWELVGIAPVTGPLDDGRYVTLEIQYVFKRPKAGKSQTMPTPTQAQKNKSAPPSPEDVARIQRTDAKKPESKTAKSDFAPRAQRAAARQPASTGKRS